MYFVYSDHWSNFGDKNMITIDCNMCMEFSLNIGNVEIQFKYKTMIEKLKFCPLQMILHHAMDRKTFTMSHNCYFESERTLLISTQLGGFVAKHNKKIKPSVSLQIGGQFSSITLNRCEFWIKCNGACLTKFITFVAFLILHSSHFQNYLYV